MHGFEINWLAVLTAAVVRFAIGGVWYSPFALGPAWGRAVGLDAAAFRGRMTRAMAVDFLAGLVLAWVLANIFQFLGVTRLISGTRTGFFLWLGFIAMPFLSMTVYEGRSWSWFAIAAGFWLVSMLAMGAVIGAW